MKHSLNAQSRHAERFGEFVLYITLGFQPGPMVENTFHQVNIMTMVELGVEILCSLALVRVETRESHLDLVIVRVSNYVVYLLTVKK